MTGRAQRAYYLPPMTKTQASQLFNGIPRMAQVLGVTRSAVYQWPEELPRAMEDRVVGAAVRIGIIPAEWPRPSDIHHN